VVLPGTVKRSLYRAVDEHGQVVDVLLRERRDLAFTQAFFRQRPADRPDPDRPPEPVLGGPDLFIARSRGLGLTPIEPRQLTLMRAQRMA